ncbi:dihydroorotate dehydrogenase electron transfer subunit [Aquibacillus kalidii]|uniref:dihydroorotate dehydrogenase electron transfer subunit n=1 Tax=Aquibacillus kalidii TaxID=2762597 RepID=UPI001645B875|nr:dihydroorotate dehydrogenase electron transfer subunit [Aquibacillus kalidii]
MNKTSVTIISKKIIAKETIELTFHAEGYVNQISPGQFIHINVGNGSSNLLRRPISIADVDVDSQIVTIIFKIVGVGTDQLSRTEVGDKLDILLPCGSGYPINQLELDRALIIGGGIGVPPLYYLAKQLNKQGVAVTAVIGFQSKDYVFYESKFKELGNCHVVTDDGSYGFKGFVTDLLNDTPIDYDYFFSCGPTGMLKAVSTQLKNRNGYISIEQRMGCGVGACYACVVPTNDGTNGFKKICKDGPVFQANEVVLV